MKPSIPVFLLLVGLGCAAHAATADKPHAIANIAPAKLMFFKAATVAPLNPQRLASTLPGGTGDGAQNATLIGDSVGATWWDWQHVNSVLPRIVNFQSGASSFIAFVSTDNTLTTAGPYYASNSDGSRFTAMLNGQRQWGRLTGNVACWWSTMAAFADASELVIANLPNPRLGNLKMAVDTDVFNGRWKVSDIPSSMSAISPAVAVGANDVIHLLYVQLGTPNVLVYRTSSDKGATWSALDSLSLYVDIGSYNISANGSMVGIVFNRLGVLETMISYDNGANWKTQGLRVAIPTGTVAWTRTHGDTTEYMTDSAAMYGRHLACVMDPHGTLHIAGQLQQAGWDSMVVANQFVGWSMRQTGYYLSDSVGGIQYTALDTNTLTGNYDLKSCGPVSGDPNGAFTVADLQYPNGAAWIDPTGVLAGWPSLGYRASDGRVFLVYGSYRLDDYRDLNVQGGVVHVMFAHVYATSSTTPFGAWGLPGQLTPDQTDAQFPALASNVDDKAVISYQADYAPGSLILNPAYWPPARMSAMRGVVTSADALGVDEGLQSMPSAITLDQNYPNPFRPLTQIRYALDHSASVRLTIHDALGRTIATLVDARQNEGLHVATFNGADLPSGMYTCTLTRDGRSVSRPMMLAR